jgi:hypothetical protein
MVHEIDYKIIGHDMQAVIITLDRARRFEPKPGPCCTWMTASTWTPPPVED